MYFSTLLATFTLAIASVTTAHPHPSATKASVERAFEDIIRNSPGPYNPRPLSLSDITPPRSPAADATDRYVKKQHGADPTLYRHLRRSHFFALALLDPGLGLFSPELLAQAHAENINETLWHGIMLHDLGLTPENINLQTPMSFELLGAFLANGYLNKNVRRELTNWQIDDITEGILQHTDLLLPGRASFLVEVMHLGIGVDALGQPVDIWRSLLHEETLKAAIREWPRTNFAEVIGGALGIELNKPGPHVSIL